MIASLLQTVSSRAALWVAPLALLAACVTLPEAPAPDPGTLDTSQSLPQELTPAVPSPQSEAFARYYRATERRQVAAGFLRTDGGGPDTPFTSADLVENFIRIALFDEYTFENGRFIDRETPARLRRWADPVRLQAHFGASVDDRQRAEDNSVLSTYATRLARVTRHPIRRVERGGNFHVLYLDTDELAAAGPLLRQLVPGISDATLREITGLGRFNFCSVYAFSPTGSSTYVRAIAVIRSEHPDLLRRSCVHEEVAQGLGLPNDSPAARPSIFNDDEEFALLTDHDEMLLAMLYDPRLRPGLTPGDARALVTEIAEERLGGPS